MSPVPPDTTLIKRLNPWFMATLAPLSVAALALPWRESVHAANIVMVLLLVVVLVASRLGRAPAMWSSVLAVLAFDVGFVPPYGLLTVHDPRYLTVFVVMLAVAWLVSGVSGASRAARLRAEANERDQRALFDLAAALNSALKSDQAIAAVSSFVAKHLGGRAAVHTLATLPTSDHIVHTAASGENPVFLREGDAEGSRRELWPLRGATRSRGVLDVVLPDPMFRQDGQGGTSSLQAVAVLLAACLERLHYLEVAIRTQTEIDAERLRLAMLSGLSHDLRTPLTVLYGWADALRESAATGADPAPAAERVCQETLRLSRLCDSLLDFARLRDAPNLLVRDWIPVEELVGTVLSQLQGVAGIEQVRLALPDPDVWLFVDGLLFERLLTNLVDNALKQGGDKQRVVVEVRRSGDHMQVVVSNSGSRFPADTESLLRPFQSGDLSQVHGFGLSLCRVIIEAHGGALTIGNLDTAGGPMAAVTLQWPQAGAPDSVAVDDLSGSTPS